jgi:hypothetical protein
MHTQVTEVCKIMKKGFKKYEGYSESNLQWAINKISNEKRIYYMQKKYVHA